MQAPPTQLQVSMIGWSLTTVVSAQLHKCTWLSPSVLNINGGLKLILYAPEESILTTTIINLLTSLARNYNILEEADQWKILTRVD